MTPKPMPGCSRQGCPNLVKEYRRHFCSPECQRLSQIKHGQPASEGTPEQPPSELTETVKADGNKCEITKVVDEEVRTLEDLIRICHIDLVEWKIERWVANKWEVAMKPPAVGSSYNWSRESDTPIKRNLFQIKAWLVRNTEGILARNELVALKESFKAERPFVPTQFERQSLTGNMLEISIPDLHAGKLAWAKETGWENYDTKIALKVYRDALQTLIARTSCYKFDEIVFVVGNDLFHSDNPRGETYKGTPLDTDSRYHKTFTAIREMMVESVEVLRQIAPVRVILVSGNHDTLSVWHLGDSLECRFYNYADVTIDNGPQARKYYQYGKVMLMFTHGHKGKLSDYPLVMAAEQPKMFGRTQFREAHTGDKHHFRVEEYHGVKVRISPALCPPDAWHADNHFVGADRAAEAFVWNESEGLICNAIYTVSGQKSPLTPSVE